MDIQVLYKFKGGAETDITSYVVSYNREKKICNGISTIEMTVAPSFFDAKDPKPWDRITLYEGGHKKGEYFVGEWSPQIPAGNVVLFAQDNSKRLQDYFIDESYLVDYPSTARYWIEKFLTEAGVDYTFTTEEYGSLLSNNTSVGLQSAYDQIINMLQISGWYMYFNADSEAVIGSLNADVNTISLSLNKHDITDIKIIKHDKMLRNRAVVWGSGDSSSGGWVYADISTTTPWNYDANDLRTVVIANSNIPSSYAAYGIAEQLLTEFARITVEKHIITTGARDVDLGDFIKVRSTFFKGIGLLTSIASEMSEGGFTTTLVLDERCPRLFAYYNFGDYVYAGTEGSGVWRKLMDFGSAWYDFSNGLTDLVVTDLYKNKGLMTSITLSGEAFYVLPAETSTWTPITIPALVASGIGEGTILVSSGVKARGVTQDRNTNEIKLITDNDLRLNPAFYSATATHLWFSSLAENDLLSSYAWLLDINDTGGLDAQYQITLSGNPNFAVLDIENDGTFDYVSAVTSGSSFPFGTENNFGSCNNFYPNAAVNPMESYSPSIRSHTPRNDEIIESFEDYIFDPDTEIAVTTVSRNAQTSIFYDGEDYKEYWYLTSSLSASAVTRKRLYWAGSYYDFNYEYTSISLVEYPFSMKRLDESTCRIYYKTNVAPITIKYVDVNVDTDEESTPVTIGSVGTSDIVPSKMLVFETVTYFLAKEYFGFSYGGVNLEYNFKFHLYTFNNETNTITGAEIYDAGGTSDLVGRRTCDQWHFYPDANATVHIAAFIIEGTAVRGDFIPTKRFDFDLYYLHGNPGSLTEEVVHTIYDVQWIQDYSFPDGVGVGPHFPTSEDTFAGFAYFDGFGMDGNEKYFQFNEDGCDAQDTPYSYQHTRDNIIDVGEDYYIFDVKPLFNFNSQFFVARVTFSGVSKYRKFDCSTFTDLGEFTVDGYKVLNIYPNADSYDNSLYVELQDTDTLDWMLVGITNAQIVKTISTSESFIEFNMSPYFSLNAGNFFLTPNSQVSTNATLSYYKHALQPIKTPIYYVMVRNENEFIPIISGFLPYRLDASSFPVLSAQDKVGTINYIYSYPNSVEVIYPTIPINYGALYLNDIRLINNDVGQVFNKRLLITTSGGMLSTELNTIAFSGVFTPSSGVLFPLETTNYKLPGQFIFTEDIEYFNFYQRDDDETTFLPYNTYLPQVPITVIRVDDMI